MSEKHRPHSWVMDDITDGREHWHCTCGCGATKTKRWHKAHEETR